MATLQRLDDDYQAGRDAADQLSHTWPDYSWVPDAPSEAWARGAVARFGELMDEQRAIFKASQQGAEKGASTLSPRPFQGILECIQNADDLAAKKLIVAYREHPTPELLITHNGSPVTLANVGAMLLPWLSTKDVDPHASGRFGIGQKTLKALGGPIALHAPPFHFVMGPGGPEPTSPQESVPGVYDPAARDTMLLLPLNDNVTAQQIAEAVRELNSDALLFLHSIRRLEFADLATPERSCAFEIDLSSEGTSSISFAEGDCDVEISNLTPVSSSDDPRAPQFRRYFVHRPTPKGEERSNKATADSTPLGVCARLAGSEPLALYDRMPLPIAVKFPVGLNAQFDPDSARSHLRHTPWNEARLKDLGAVVSWAALQAFGEHPPSAWHHVPLQAEIGDRSDWLTNQLFECVVEPCHKRLKADLIITTSSGQVPVQKLSYEAEELEGLVSEEDLRTLLPSHVPLPRAARDVGGRWRRVLSELGRSRIATVADALRLLKAGLVREPTWFVRFAILAHESYLLDDFLRRPSLLLADGRVVSCPTRSEGRVLAKSADASSLAARLGLVQQLHPAYFDGEETSNFIRDLERRQALVHHSNGAAAALEILGRADRLKEPIRLKDGDLIELRDAWAKLPREREARLGQRIGLNIALRAVRFDQASKSEHVWARLSQAYLPAAIDRETDSFAKAAGRTPGLLWIDKTYAKILKHAGGRSQIGAQRLLSAWGVAREPRLIKPSNLRVYYQTDPTPTSPIWGVDRPEAQIAAIPRECTDLIGDHWAPDLEAVVENILKGPAKTRRKRSITLLAVLSRGWERRYAEYQTAKAAYGHYSWHVRGEVKATWLARLSDEPWLPDASNGLRYPSELQLPVPGVATPLKDRNRTLGKVDDQIHRSGILAALGVKSGPTPAELIEQLQNLKAQKVTPEVIKESLLIYQLLASSLQKDDAFPGETITPAQLRNAFRAGRDGRGLLLAQGEWRSPEAVFQGPMIFGDRRPFAPLVEGLEPLWKALNIPFPTGNDAIAVLKELSGSVPSPADLGVMVMTLRFLASKMLTLSPQVRGKLKQLPLWDGSRWTTARPIFAFEGEELLGNVPGHIPTWRPGITSFAGLELLLQFLNVTKLDLSDFRPVSTTAYGFTEGEELRQTFAGAVSLLKQEFMRADQSLLDGIAIDWAYLLSANVAVDPELSVVAEPFPGKRIIVPMPAHMWREPLTLLVRSPHAAGAAEGAGQAIGSLFTGDRQKVAWAWAAVWQRASSGERADRVILPKTKADRATSSGRLSELKQQSETRQGRKAKTSTHSQNGQQVIQVRKLRDLDKLAPNEGTIVNPGAQLQGTVFANRSGQKGERTFSKPENSNAGENTTSAIRSVLPPTNDREALALEAVRRALRLDAQEIVDLRSRRGVGVDAIDELRQCYEIKMSSSATIPTDVTLTPNEVDAAKSDPDFFLAVVSGLEDGSGKLRVRFIFDPLNNLTMKIKGDVTLTGVDQAEALEYEFSVAECAPDPE
jgi:hypothetical protein